MQHDGDLLKRYPVILGVKYYSKEYNKIAILVYADIKEDLIKLKSIDTPWVFESNHATFSYYWKLY